MSWRTTVRGAAAAVVLAAAPAAAQQNWTTEQREVLAAMDWLSAATAPDGLGPDAYAAALAPDFSRWTVGSTVMSGKYDWVRGVREWFDDGWRVAQRSTRHLEITVIGDLALTRRIVEETYRGPDGEESRSTAALAEVWTRRDGPWLLLRVNVHPMEG